MEQADSLRESEERFRGAFQAAAIGFALVDLEGRLRVVNEPLCRMLGYSEAELVASNYRELTHPDDLAADEALRLRVLSGEGSTNHTEKRYLHKNGRVVWGLLAVSLVRTAKGEAGYFVAQITDITRQKAAEQALARHAAELERSNEELREYASVASHDLQAPLRTVGSYAKLVAERYGEVLDEAGRRWLGYVVDGVERMHRLIDDMLALARVRTEGHGFSETDVGKRVASVWAELEQQYGDVGARLIVEPLPVVRADEAQLDLLFRNLLVNALKYRRADVPLEIRVSAERLAAGRGEDAGWQFSVADNGIGFDMVHARRIFEMFQRLHREGEYEGTGIGLAICRRIAERHGGRIWVEAAPGQGATFRFTLEARSPLAG
jgi:PAS domain S-box-containing protein